MKSKPSKWLQVNLPKVMIPLDLKRLTCGKLETLLMKSFLLSLFMIVSISSFAQNVEKRAQLYGTCIQCHGDKGLGVEDQKAPRISGQYDWYIYTQLVNFKLKKG